MNFPNSKSSYEIIRPGGEQITNSAHKAALGSILELIARNAANLGPIREVTSETMKALLKGVESQLVANGITHDARNISAYTVKVYFQALASTRENPAGHYLLKFEVRNK